VYISSKNIVRITGLREKAFDIHLSLIAVVCLLSLDYGFTLESLFWPVGSLFLAYGLHEASRRWVGIKILGINPAQCIYYPFGSIWRPSPGTRLFENQTRGTILLFALSGPLMNLACGVALALFGSWVFKYSPVLNDAASNLLAGNALFGLLRLLPAPGLDGGIVLEQMLLTPEGQPLLKVARVGQLVGVALCLVSLFFGSLAGLLLGGMVFISSVKIFLNQSACHSLGKTCAMDLMRPVEQIDYLEHGSKVSTALKLAKSSLQDFFPVIQAGELVGIIERSALITHKMSSPQDAYITGLTSEDFLAIAPQEQLATVVDLELVEQNTPLLVVEERELKGMIPLNSLIEILILESQVDSQLDTSSLDDEIDE
jgi:predicted transcriptional regulator